MLNSVTTVKLNDTDTRIPQYLLIGILVVCVTPFVLTLLGMDFGTRGAPMDHAWALQAPKNVVIDAQFQSLSGAFTHTLLEWSAFCVAVFVVFMAFSHYKITSDVTTPIIGVAFFMAGCMDAFHTLAADRLIDAVAENGDLIPFTWAVCRLFNVLIMIAGVSILFFRNRKGKKKAGVGFVAGISLIFGVVAYVIIHISATSANLPQTTFPDSVLTRPYDALPLMLFVFAGLVVYPKLYKRYPSLFAHALIVSAVPQVVTQLHMTFGSTALFDSHFNIAHFMKIVAYTIPLIGLMLDYIRAHKALQFEIAEREEIEAALKESEGYQRTILDTVADGIITIDRKGIVNTFNHAAESIFGYQAAEIVGKNVSMLMSGKEQKEHENYTINSTLRAPRIIDQAQGLEGRRKDGLLFPLELNVSPMEVLGNMGFVGILRDVTERHKIDKMKSEFISTVSHELRTPLTSIRGSLGLVTGGAVGELPEQAKEMLKIASNNTERLLLLINDILDIQKIESHEMSFNFQSLELMPFLEQSLQDNAAYGDQFNVWFVLSSELDKAWIYADPDRLMQVMGNLLSNAAKYSPAGELVNVSLTRRNNGFRISVADRGAGVPENFQPKLFEKFTQADSSDERQKGGTGLGLSIAKLIVEKHNGQIGFISEDGIGATFYIDLPELADVDKKKEV